MNIMAKVHCWSYCKSIHESKRGGALPRRTSPIFIFHQLVNPVINSDTSSERQHEATHQW